MFCRSAQKRSDLHNPLVLDAGFCAKDTARISARGTTKVVDFLSARFRLPQLRILRLLYYFGVLEPTVAMFLHDGFVIKLNSAILISFSIAF